MCKLNLAEESPVDIQPVVVDRGLLRARSDSGETWEDGGGVGLGGGVVGDLDGGVGDFDQKQMVKGAGEGLDLEAWQFGEPSTWSESTPVARSWANLPKWPQFVAVQVILFHLT